jgi:stage II sporulation protein P
VRAVEGTLARRALSATKRRTRPSKRPTPSRPSPPPASPGGAAPEPAKTEPASPSPLQQLVAVYYTHNDESYIPTDGKPTIGETAASSVSAVRSPGAGGTGYAVENDQTRHDPHDANAYHRSRRTFKRLLERKPAALFDIHRDSAPLQAYKLTINGQPAAKLLLVVGRQNQNRETTMNYAKKIKAAADSKYKGLIRGIFIAHGNYNQDLNPRAMLIEVGTQYNSREEAERSATLFADVVPLFLAPPAPPPATGTAPPPAAPPGGYWRDILTILAVLAAGIAGFMFINTGSWRETKRKLSRFRRFEFINFFARKRKD